MYKLIKVPYRGSRNAAFPRSAALLFYPERFAPN